MKNLPKSNYFIRNQYIHMINIKLKLPGLNYRQYVIKLITDCQNLLTYKEKLFWLIKNKILS